MSQRTKNAHISQWLRKDAVCGPMGVSALSDKDDAVEVVENHCACMTFIEMSRAGALWVIEPMLMRSTPVFA